MATRTRSGSGSGLVDAVKVDIQMLYGAWMELLFPRQRGRGHSVMGKWTPETPPQKVAYHLWSVLGALGIVVLYPLTVLGFAIRFYAGKLDSTTNRLGIVGVTAVALLVWGALTVVAHLELPYDAFLAIAAASSAAIVSTTLAAACSKFGGRGLSVFLAYPFAMTALFLPPVVAALVTPSLESVVLDPSYNLAAWLLDNVLFVGGLNETLRASFNLEGSAYALMWVGFSFPLGWFLGVVVALANLVRPSS